MWVYTAFIVITLLCVAYTIYAQQNMAYQEKISEEKQKQAEELAVQKKVYDEIIDNMLTDLKTRAENYKKFRKVMREMIMPDNYADEKSAEQTYRFFMDGWKKIETEHINAYVDFFAKEEKLLQAYQELVAFYYTHRAVFKIDEKTGEIIFKNQKDEAQHNQLMQKIAILENTK